MYPHLELASNHYFTDENEATLMTETNKKPQPPRPNPATSRKTRSVHLEATLRFASILAVLCVFVVQVLMALSLVREVKEVVAAANVSKSAAYQRVVDNPDLQPQLASEIARYDQEIASAEAQLDVDINKVTISCMITVVVAIGLTLTTADYLKRRVVDEMVRFKDECEKLAVGNLELDFSTDSYVTEVVELSQALEHSTSELRRIIYTLAEGINSLANKDFAINHEFNFPGQFSALDGLFSKLVVTISNTLGEIMHSAHEVTLGAHQVSNGAQTLAQGATEQAGSVDHLSQTIGEIAKMVTDTTESAHKANKLGAVATDVLHTSTKEMGELMVAIDQIEKSSSTIEEIIKTIDDIAFQTNILALNAAIEAARAGQFGKSFAVVADEVRTLAQKSAECAQNTTTQIETSLEAIRQGAALAKSTNQAFSQVRSNSDQILDMVQHIADSSQHQNDSIEEVCASVSEISAVISHNSATSEESAAASEELSGQAQIMNTMLQDFKLDKKIFHLNH